MTVFHTVQTNGSHFRASFVKYEKRVLWIAESSEEIYCIQFDKALSADLYQTETNFKVIFLYANDDEVESIDFGNFTSEDGLLFLKWLQSNLD